MSETPRASRLAARKSRSSATPSVVNGPTPARRGRPRKSTSIVGEQPAPVAIGSSHARGVNDLAVYTQELETGPAAFARAFNQSRRAPSRITEEEYEEEVDEEVEETIEDTIHVARPETRTEAHLERIRSRAVPQPSRSPEVVSDRFERQVNHEDFISNHRPRTAESVAPSELDVSKSFGTLHEGGLAMEEPQDVNSPPRPPLSLIVSRFFPKSRVQFFRLALLGLLLALLTHFALYCKATYNKIEPTMTENDTLMGSQTAGLTSLCARSWYGDNIQRPLGSIYHSLPSIRLPASNKQDSGVQNRAIVYLDDKIADLQRQQNLHSHTINKLDAMIPSMIAVEKDETNGKIGIPADFWHALRVKMEEDGFSKGGATLSGGDWPKFWKQNKIKIDNLVAGSFKDALKRHTIVTKEEFMEMINESKKETIRVMEQQVSSVPENLLPAIRDDIMKVAKEAARQVTVEQIELLSQQQLSSVAAANLFRNSELALKTVDFFSNSLGSRVEPHLTSPTQKKQESWGRWLFHTLAWVPARNPPSSALRRWEEAADCWCAAPSTYNGKAQLAVTMFTTIYPTKVTVEHVPKEGTLDITSAPRTLEIWILLRDPATRKEVERAYSSLGLSACEASGSLTSTAYVCVGSWQYEIHAPNHVQTYTLPLDLTGLGAATDKAVIRVRENWGAQWTCLYRIRMHGKVFEVLD